MIDKLLTAIKPIVEQELKDSFVNYRAFHSQHEGYAILKEEVEEAEVEYEFIISWMNSLWYNIKNDYLKSSNVDIAKHLKQHSDNLAAEAIQVSAMAQKYILAFGGAENA